MTAKTIGVATAYTFVILAALGSAQRPVDQPSVIVQAASLEAAQAAVLEAGGRVTHELRIIHAVSARLSADQADALRRAGEVRLYADGRVRTAAFKSGPHTYYPTLAGAASLHAEGLLGNGVGVAILDTGLFAQTLITKELTPGNSTRWRTPVQYDAIQDSTYVVQPPGTKPVTTDASGHGSHVTSIILMSQRDPSGAYMSIAPAATLISIKAFGADGGGTYADVIRGIDWAVANKAAYNIRVLNCSFSAPPRSYYWDDPMNQAIMKAWQAGIVVVASAGNAGPAPMTIGAPGNVPYVITVGAMTDNNTPQDPNDDRLASFSAAGPTVEGFVKPDLVAPGGHMIAKAQNTARIPTEHPEFKFDYNGETGFFTMSGTSQAAAVVSGVAALMLQADPTLTPDDVKCGLMATARVARKNQFQTTYSVFQQGAGLVNAYDAVHGGDTACANGGLDVAKDLAGTQHYGGPAWQDPLGYSYSLLDQFGAGTLWNGQYSQTGGYPWSNGYPWADGYPWSNGYPWSDSYPWSNGYPWSSGFPWSNSLAEPASINVWVPQE